MAMVKQATTMETQATLPTSDFDVVICLRPWIVELSKKSEITADAIIEE